MAWGFGRGLGLSGCFLGFWSFGGMGVSVAVFRERQPPSPFIGLLS